MNCRRFEQRVVVVTGASQGIGRAMAGELAREGASLVLNARDAGRLDAVCNSPEMNAAQLAWVAGDVREQTTIESIVDTALTRFGRIDALINNVGGGTAPQPIADITDETWHDNLDANLTSAFLACRRILPLMQQRGYGRVVNISSVAGRNRGNLSGMGYAAAKAGLQGLTRQLAWDVGPFGITVNALAPGLTETPRAMDKLQQLPPDQQATILARTALKRVASPLEIARAALFLASDDASYITGATLDVNGGLWMG